MRTEPKNTGGSPMAPARLSLRNWPFGATVTTNGAPSAVEPVALYGVSETVPGTWFFV